MPSRANLYIYLTSVSTPPVQPGWYRLRTCNIYTSETWLYIYIYWYHIVEVAIRQPCHNIRSIQQTKWDIMK